MKMQEAINKRIEFIDKGVFVLSQEWGKKNSESP